MSIAPGSVAVGPTQTQQFTATVTGTANTAVTWVITEGTTGGTVSTAGLYTAPTTSGTYHVVATSVADVSKSATAVVGVAVASPSISGTVSYGGTKTGRLYVNMSYGGNGTSIAAPGAYTIRGITNQGSTQLIAWIDTLGIGTYVPGADPYGQVSINLTGTSLTGVNITLVDPAAVTPAQAQLQGVFVTDQTAFVLFNSQIDADRFDVFASTTPNPGPMNNVMVKTPLAGGMNFALMSPLTNGSSYYFAVAAKRSGVSGPISAQVGPVTIGAPTGNFSVSGTVTAPTTLNGPLFVGVYSNTGGAFAARIVSPAASQSFTVTGIPNGVYQLFAFVDRNGDGVLGPTDPTTFSGVNTVVTVAGANVTGQSIAVPVTDAISTAPSQHFRSNAGTDSYDLDFAVRGVLKLPVKVVLTSGPNVTPPIDIGLATCGGAGNCGGGSVRFRGNVYLGMTAPTVGATYTFDVLYSDLTTATLTGSVNAVLNYFATLTSPAGTGAWGTQPVFTWVAPSGLPASFSQQFSVEPMTGMGSIWRLDQMPPTQITCTYNSDFTASLTNLLVGVPYRWRIGYLDATGNKSEIEKNFTIQ